MLVCRCFKVHIRVYLLGSYVFVIMACCSALFPIRFWALHAVFTGKIKSTRDQSFSSIPTINLSFNEATSTVALRLSSINSKQIRKNTLFSCR